MNNTCIFCSSEIQNGSFIENDLFFAYWDENPVSEGHALIIPKQHTESYFELSNEEVSQMFDLTREVKSITDDKYNPAAYNLGINDGEAAGRTVHHLHLHVIPRYTGDVENPRGGIRHTLPGKGDY